MALAEAGIPAHARASALEMLARDLPAGIRALRRLTSPGQ